MLLDGDKALSTPLLHFEANYDKSQGGDDENGDKYDEDNCPGQFPEITNGVGCFFDSFFNTPSELTFWTESKQRILIGRICSVGSVCIFPNNFPRLGAICPEMVNQIVGLIWKMRPIHEYSRPVN